jgi:acetyl esterase
VEYSVTTGTVAGRDGVIPIRDYRPAGRSTAAPFLWVHGGGFVSGGLDQKESDAPARVLAASGRWVRTLDYRLAPNIGLFTQPVLGPDPGRFPSPHHDVLDVAAALREESGVAIGLGGASAGAALAAGAAVAMRDEGIDAARTLVLVYGVLHAVLPEDDAIEAGLRGPLVRWFFNPGMTRRMNLNFVGSETGLADPRAFAGGSELSGLPSTLTVDAGNDRLRRSGHAFHLELLHAGVPAEEVVVPARHGFLGAPRKRPFTAGMAAVQAWLERFDTT